MNDSEPNAALPSDEGSLDGFCSIVAQSLGVPSAFLGIVRDGVVEFLAGDGCVATVVPRPSSFADATAETGSLVIEDARADPRFRDHAKVMAEGGWRFYAGTAFDIGAPARRGVLAVVAPEPRSMSAAERGRLESYGRVAAALLRAAPIVTAAGSETAGSDFDRRPVAAAVGRVGGWDYPLDGSPGVWSRQMFSIFDIPEGPVPALDEMAAAFSAEARGIVGEALDGARTAGMPFDVEVPLISRAGKLKVVRLIGEVVTAGTPRRVFGVAQDVTARQRADEAGWRMANHDSLTRLGNRRLFEQSVEMAIETARVDGSRLGLLVIDLDYFGEINVSLGHEVGDVLLAVIAGRLRRFTADEDEVARFGGDEFALLLRDVGEAGRLFERARDVIQVIEEPVTIAGRDVYCRASVGGALFPDHARSANDLLARAVAALDRAKSTGRRIAVLYDDQMRWEPETRFRVHEAIRGALMRDEIFPYYQPKLSLATGKLVGLEALVRWRTGRDGVVMPAEFNSALADGFLGSAIGTRVIEKVTDDIRDWLEAGLPFGSVAVNASAFELMRGAYHEQVAEILSRKQIPFDCFQVEVTETVFVQHEGRDIRETVRKLDAMGVRVALDDFGTGFGSLVHLRRFAVSEIKIDRSFIAGIETSDEDRLIVRTLIELGHGLGKTVVAEGVERESERATLAAFGCDYGQGYLFSLPLPRAEVTRFIAERAGG